MRYLKTLLIAFVLLGSFPAAAQESTNKSKMVLTGYVYDAVTKQPIPGASVGIVGVTSTFTDEKGAFGLHKTADNASLQVKATGYATQVVPIKQQTQFTLYLNDASLVTSNQDLIMPFETMDKIRNTASVSTFDGTSFKQRGVASSEELLQGASGLNTIARSGAVGSGANFYIRGFNSMNTNTQPLIVVDGMPFDNKAYGTSLIGGNMTTPLSYTEAKDIENVTILKDGTSLYGSKGSNGVILITTIRPKEMITRINFHAYMGANMAPTQRYSMLKADDYRSYLYDMLQSSGKYQQTELQDLPYFNTVKPYEEKWGWEGNTDYYRYHQETDWQDVVFRNSLSNNYYIDIKGGDDVAVFALSLGYMNHQGIVEGTDFSRYTARFNSRYTMSREFTLTANMSFNYGEKNLKDEGNVQTNPLMIALNKAPFMTTYFYDETNVRSASLEGADVNPWVAVNNTMANSKNYRFYTTIAPEYKLGRDLKLAANLGLTTDKTTEVTFYPMQGMSYPDHLLGPVTNMMGRRSLRFFQVYSDVYADYSHQFASDNQLKLRAGFRYEYKTIEEDWSKGYNSSTDDMKSIGSGDPDYARAGGLLGDSRWLSYYANATYTYKNRYYLNADASLDGSSRYGKDAPGLVNMFDTPFAGFGSIGAAWLISSEPFIEMPEWFDLAKIRASIGTAGNDDIGDYAAQKYYTSSPFYKQYGVVRGNISNTELQWESSLKRNIALDAAFLKDRLQVSIDFYSNTTNNLLCSRMLNSDVGLYNYWDNNGTLTNKGVEASVQGRILNGEVKWDAGMTVSKNTNVLSQYGDNRTLTNFEGGTILTEVGHPIALFYGYKTNGIYQTDAEAATDGLTTLTPNGSVYSYAGGDVRFLNLDNSDQRIDEKDRTVIGDPNPDFFGSFHTSIKWKRFTASALMTYSVGGDVYNVVRMNLESMTGTSNQTAAVNNRWRADDQNATMPRATWGDPAGNARFSDRWIEDGSYAKLKTLSVSYQIPVRNLPVIRNAEVYVTGNNLLTLTKYLGYDPEFNISQNPLYYGIDTGLTPQSASVLFGVRIGL
jgi:TonB-linked SusC/RagA family outer membrane protein